MKDPRLEILAKNILHYSVNLQPGQNILIELFDQGEELAASLIKEAYSIGANPFLSIKNKKLFRELITGCNENQVTRSAYFDAERMKHMHAYVSINGSDNASEYSDVPSDKLNLYSNLHTKKVHFEIRVPNTKWCIMSYPTSTIAQKANMSTEAFEDFYFKVCTLDYAKMSKAMDALVALMQRTDKVRILGPGTDLSFSIKDIPVTKCSGEFNIPDGEVYSAPIIDSVNGYITYNTPSTNFGFTFENVRLEFEKGKIMKATANDTEKINKLFDTDEGARYIGEFAIGVNPYITKPMNDILFDEKIAGSIHFTPGNAYEDSDNGNRSSLHWDLVLIQTPEFGGGEIWFDDVLIRKDGRFVAEELLVLNPENLV